MVRPLLAASNFSQTGCNQARALLELGGRMSRNFSLQTLLCGQALPEFVQGTLVVRAGQQLHDQTAHQTLRGQRAERPMLGQQQRGVQRTGGLTGQARGLELDAQGHGVAGHGPRQLRQLLQAAQGIAVVQAPARGTQAQAFTQSLLFCPAGLGRLLFSLL